jgi:hypothetical protein
MTEPVSEVGEVPSNDILRIRFRFGANPVLERRNFRIAVRFGAVDESG